MNRRDFLHPRQLGRTAGHVIGALDELHTPTNEPTGEEIALLRLARSAMATTFEVVLPLGTPLAAAETALDEIDRLEDQLTVYRETSEVSRINRLAAREPVVVEGQLSDLLQRAAQITEDTEGAFDITTGALSKAWGFFQRCQRVPTLDERSDVLTRVGMDKMVLNPAQRTVAFLQPGLEINLGSIGKGYALDRAADLLRHTCHVSTALLHGGHSSVYAIGREPGNPRGWTVGIQHPHNLHQRLAVVWLRDRALGTSAATFQNLEYAGRKLGHILDPRTGWPAEGMASATVIAPTAAAADALATAFFILGVEKARAYCAEHSDIGSILLPSGEGVDPVVLGLAADDVQLLSMAH